MSNISLLDCTLRDGGYINNWEFGQASIKNYCEGISRTGIEMFEVGFIFDGEYNPDRNVFADVDSIVPVIGTKKDMIYLAMVDMNRPVSIDKLLPKNDLSVDGIRVIFKKDKTKEAFEYVKVLTDGGYKVFVQFVCADFYEEDELIKSISMFNQAKPYAMSIVDTFGSIEKEEFIHLVDVFNSEMEPGIALGYHGHNNLRQALLNAEILITRDIDRDLIIDGCIFGMGRGAGNLCLEIIADYLNRDYSKDYVIEEILKLMNGNIKNIYDNGFIGYNLPLYICAKNKCHPYYGVFYSKFDNLGEDQLGELIRSISDEDKLYYSEEKAINYYRLLNR